MTSIDVEIRPARADDAEFVVGLISTTLEPYYGGDHRAHAERILNTHLAGGTDRLGFFSIEQRMFIAEADRQKCGIIHLVGKRQGTYKISPLIVVNEFRGAKGIGSVLLKHAETYARSRTARHLYCTVAETNSSALQFFLGRGFVRSGISESQYKIDVREIMLYKILDDPTYDGRFDRQHLSVTPFSEDLAEDVRALLLRRLPSEFEGIDDQWVDSLFAGYSRRASGDINTKYKLIYVARDELKRVCGVVGATPKKGEPIKLMPFVAEEPPSFNALVTDMPYLLKQYGRKVYIHIVPTVDEVVLLQRRGWMLDGLLPGGYHPERVTQQWSYDVLNRITMRHLRVKQQFLDAIKDGSKTVEVRVAYDHLVSIHPGEHIRLISRGDSATMKIRDIRRYASFDELVDAVDPGKIVPGSDRAEVLELLRGIYSPEKEALGVLALSLDSPDAKRQENRV